MRKRRCDQLVVGKSRVGRYRLKRRLMGDHMKKLGEASTYATPNLPSQIPLFILGGGVNSFADEGEGVF